MVFSTALFWLGGGWMETYACNTARTLTFMLVFCSLVLLLLFPLLFLFSSYLYCFRLSSSFVLFFLSLFLFFYRLLQWFHLIVFLILSEHTCTPAKRFSRSSFSFFSPLLLPLPPCICQSLKPSSSACASFCDQKLPNPPPYVDKFSIASIRWIILSAFSHSLFNDAQSSIWFLKIEEAGRGEEKGKSGPLVSSERTGFYKTY